TTGARVWPASCGDPAWGLYVLAWGGLGFGGTSSFDPALASSASFGSVGAAGDEPEPLPAEPPQLIFVRMPWMSTPAGVMLMKLPPTLSEICTPPSRMMFIPALRLICWPEPTSLFILTLYGRF